MGIKPTDAGLESVMETHNKAAAIRHALLAYRGAHNAANNLLYLLTYGTSAIANDKAQEHKPPTTLLPISGDCYAAVDDAATLDAGSGVSFASGSAAEAGIAAGGLEALSVLARG